MNFDPKIISDYDQVSKLMNDTLAMAMSSFYKKLVEEGLPHDLAAGLTHELMHTLLGSASTFGCDYDGRGADSL